MNELKIVRSHALGLFRRRLAHPIKDLNTLVVGLAPIRAGTLTQTPPGLSVRWEVGDAVRTTDQARGSAISALMINACDTLDQYLAALGTNPSPIKDGRIKAFLRRESRSPTVPPAVPTPSQLQKLIEQLASDPISARTVFKGFADRHYGKTVKATLRGRFAEICDAISQFSPNSAAPACPKASYVAAVHLLVCWRNRQVHEESFDTFDAVHRESLVADAANLKNDHADIDILKTLTHYDGRTPPTLKDVSTLVSILLRTVQAIDEVLIYHADLNDLLRQVTWIKVRRLPMKDRKTFIERLTAASLTGRVDRLKPLWDGAGFTPTSFEDKKGAFAARVLNLSTTFLETDKTMEFLNNEDYQ